MIALILIKKIAALFLILISGVALVRLKLLKAEDSKPLSSLCVWLIMPCVTLSAFQVDFTEEVMQGFLLAMAASVAIHVIFILFWLTAGKWLKLSEVEVVSILYPNSGNLIVPLVTSMFGKEYVIYASAFMITQQFMIWSHGKSVLCGEKSINIKKILTNPNMIAVFAGIFLLVTGIRFPEPVAEAIDSTGSTVGPICMIITGMLIGSMDLKKVFSYPRLWLTVALRLVILPFVILLLLCASRIWTCAAEGTTVLLITFLAVCSCSASTVVQLATLYDRDADYASAINVGTTLLCIATMPMMIALYSLFIH